MEATPNPRTPEERHDRRMLAAALFARPVSTLKPRSPACSVSPARPSTCGTTPGPRAGPTRWPPAGKGPTPCWPTSKNASSSPCSYRGPAPMGGTTSNGPWSGSTVSSVSVSGAVTPTLPGRGGWWTGSGCPGRPRRQWVLPAQGVPRPAL